MAEVNCCVRILSWMTYSVKRILKNCVNCFEVEQMPSICVVNADDFGQRGAWSYISWCGIGLRFTIRWCIEKGLFLTFVFGREAMTK